MASCARITGSFSGAISPGVAKPNPLRRALTVGVRLPFAVLTENSDYSMDCGETHDDPRAAADARPDGRSAVAARRSGDASAVAHPISPQSLQLPLPDV